jgi:hypothetical protein
LPEVGREGIFRSVIRSLLRSLSSVLEYVLALVDGVVEIIYVDMESSKLRLGTQVLGESYGSSAGNGVQDMVE